MYSTYIGIDTDEPPLLSLSEKRGANGKSCGRDIRAVSAVNVASVINVVSVVLLSRSMRERRRRGKEKSPRDGLHQQTTKHHAINRMGRATRSVGGRIGIP